MAHSQSTDRIFLSIHRRIEEVEQLETEVIHTPYTPDDILARAHNNRGTARRLQGRHYAAQEDYCRAASKAGPARNMAIPLVSRGLGWLSLGHPRSDPTRIAMQDYRAALTRDPHSPEAHRHLGDALRASGRIRDGMSALTL